MARRNGARGLDVIGVISNVPLAVTFFVAVTAWLTAFIGQIISEHKYDEIKGNTGSGVGTPWFGIFLQLILIGFFFYVLASGLLEVYRFQLTAFLSIAVVFSVLGTNEGIYSKLSYLTAVGAGWILLSMVNILWLLFITADDETRLSLVLSSYAVQMTNGRTRSMRQSHRASSAMGMSNPSASDLHSANGSYGNPGGHGGYGMAGLGSTKMGTSLHSVNSHPGMGVTGMGSMGSPNLSTLNSAAGMSMQQSQHAGLQPQSQSQQNLGQTAPTSVNGGTVASATEGRETPSQLQQGDANAKVLKAKALYGYTASPDDPNEISFVKGEILDILDNSGKWYSARKQDGTQGIVPSNYLQML